MATRLPSSAHAALPWRIHELTRDFEVEDLWAIRTPGAGADDFPAVLAAMRAPRRNPLPLRALFAVRWKLGAVFGWDRPGAGVGNRVPAVRDRLPDDLRATVAESAAGLGPLTPVYVLDDECALELANKTVHAVMHLGWVPAAHGGHELRMAVLVKPNGLLGRLYLAGIAPFRRLFVLPAFIRQKEHAWHEQRSPQSDGVGPGHVTGEVGTANVPEAVRALSSLPAIDYADHFSQPTSTVATPEEWARAMFGNVPGAAQRLIWRGLLGLRLSRGRSPDTVAGWRIAGRGEDWIRLEAASWFLSGNLVVGTAGGRVSLATFLHYGRPLGHAVWPPLSAIHRCLASGLLPAAEANILASRSPETRLRRGLSPGERGSDSA
ncbi:DUF2867 domain-containing protein [Streptomyces sp. NPDC017260]|uniref:DUF2867 domain-containing protein n=1 Tax=unclassified Streptomyces TaxID=2593676 RepID=UPI0037B930FB